MAKIYAPNERYTGLVASVSFVNGVGETQDKWLIGWLEEKGYRIVEEKTEETFIQDVEQAYDLALREQTNRYLESLKVDELKELAKEKEIDGYSKMKKSELLEALVGE